MLKTDKFKEIYGFYPKYPLQMPDMVPAIEVSWRSLPGGQLSDR